MPIGQIRNPCDVWKEGCSRIWKMIFPCVKHANTKIQIQNTQIHKYSIRRSARKTQHVVYFWKADCSRISKNIFPCVKRANTKMQIHKYTNTQIRHLTKCLKDPTCGIFLKRGFFKDIKNYIQGRVFPVTSQIIFLPPHFLADFFCKSDARGQK